jgi:hypothetical protein
MRPIIYALICTVAVAASGALVMYVAMLAIY